MWRAGWLTYCALRTERCEVDAGQISINGWANVVVEFEEGGFKASGSGRLCGTAALDDYLEYKQITQSFGGQH